ncbi:unnamed protein product, partial [Medioppia subpectinata]
MYDAQRLWVDMYFSNDAPPHMSRNVPPMFTIYSMTEQYLKHIDLVTFWPSVYVIKECAYANVAPVGPNVRKLYITSNLCTTEVNEANELDNDLANIDRTGNRTHPWPTTKADIKANITDQYIFAFLKLHDYVLKRVKNTNVHIFIRIIIAERLRYYNAWLTHPRKVKLFANLNEHNEILGESRAKLINAYTEISLHGNNWAVSQYNNYWLHKQAQNGSHLLLAQALLAYGFSNTDDETIDYLLAGANRNGDPSRLWPITLTSLDHDICENIVDIMLKTVTYTVERYPDQQDLHSVVRLLFSEKLRVLHHACNNPATVEFYRIANYKVNELAKVRGQFVHALTVAAQPGA